MGMGSLLESFLNWLCAPSPPQEGQQQQQQQQQQWQEQKPHYKQDANQTNQSNLYYKNLRRLAVEEGDQMAKAFAESKEAYARGDGALAKELSNRGKEHQRKMEGLNKQASDWIFTELNPLGLQDSQRGEVDLHGLFVKEAVERTDRAIQEARARGETEIRLIVGKGMHSDGQVAKIKPAVEDLMVKHNLQAELDPHNGGVLIVQMGAGSPRSRGVGPDEITRRLENSDNNCIVM
ncbi:DUF1771-domain-containing protein [Fistulina hepatica ATCC 64428]|nr:DUF1771-domain-containing protein [Fistulina hepatica ATCC 64428]